MNRDVFRVGFSELPTSSFSLGKAWRRRAQTGSWALSSPLLPGFAFSLIFFSSLLLAWLCGRCIAALPHLGMSLEAAAGGLAPIWEA